MFFAFVFQKNASVYTIAYIFCVEYTSNISSICIQRSYWVAYIYIYVKQSPLASVVQASSYADIDRDVAASFLTYTYEPRIGHSHQFLKREVSGNHVHIPCMFHCVPMVFQQWKKYFLTLSLAVQSIGNVATTTTTTTITTTNITTITTTTTDENISFTCFILSSWRKPRKKASFSHF